MTTHAEAFAQLDEITRHEEAETAAAAAWTTARAAFFLRPSLTYYAACVARLEYRPSWDIETAATDGRILWVRPDWFAALAPSRRLAVLAHEIAHCLHRHQTRRGQRDPRRWNVAGDLAINTTLRQHFDTGPDWLYPEQFDQPPDLSAEAYYAALDQADVDKPETQQGLQEAGTVQDPQKPQADTDPPPQPQPQAPQPQPQDQPRDGRDDGDTPGTEPGTEPGDGQPGDGQPGDSQPQGGSHAAGHADLQAEDARWQQIAAEAAEACRSRGLGLPGGLRDVAPMPPPARDVDDALQSFIAPDRSDYSLKRPSRTGLMAGLYLSSRHSEALAPVVVALDTSGSIGQGELQAFVARLRRIADLAPATLRLLYHTSRVYEDQTWHPDDGPLTLRPTRGGGTCHAQALQMAAEPLEDGSEAAALVLFTDCETDWPPPPPMPVLIVRLGTGNPPPWPHDLVDIATD